MIFIIEHTLYIASSINCG